MVGTLGLSSDPSFIEDARARAPNVSQQALRVAKPEAGIAGGGCSGRAPPTPSMPQVASLGVDRCAVARSDEEVQDMFGTGLSRQVGDRPTDSGAADSKGVGVHVPKGALTRRIAQSCRGHHRGTVRRPRQVFQVCLPCVRQDTLGIGASSDGQLAWPGRSLRVALWRSSL